MRIGRDGLAAGVRYVASPNCNERPEGESVTLLVVHAISLPPGEFGGDAVERLFTNQLDPEAHPYFRAVHELGVSAHFFVRRDASVIQFVPVWQRAWHAGDSVWRGRAGCNDFSVGVELEGTDECAFEDAQYLRLAELAGALRAVLPITDVAGHSDIAPGRKTDPGPHFDWLRWLALCARR